MLLVYMLLIFSATSTRKCFLFYVSGDVLVILDFRPDELLFEAGVAREVCYR